jgi:hypothetical protein
MAPERWRTTDDATAGQMQRMRMHSVGVVVVVVVVVVVGVGGGRGVVVVVVVVVGGGFGGDVMVVGSGRGPGAGAAFGEGATPAAGAAPGAGLGPVAGAAPGAGLGPVADVGPVVGVAGAATNVTPAVARVAPVGPVDDGDPTDVWRGGVVVAWARAGAGAGAGAGVRTSAVGVVAAAVVGPEVVVTLTSRTPCLGSLGPGPPGEAMTSTPSNSPTTARPANVPARCERACGIEAGAPRSSSTKCSAVVPAGSVPAPCSSIGNPFLGTGTSRSLPPRKTSRDLETCGPARSSA